MAIGGDRPIFAPKLCQELQNNGDFEFLGPLPKIFGTFVQIFGTLELMPNGEFLGDCPKCFKKFSRVYAMNIPLTTTFEPISIRLAPSSVIFALDASSTSASLGRILPFNKILKHPFISIAVTKMSAANFGMGFTQPDSFRSSASLGFEVSLKIRRVSSSVCNWLVMSRLKSLRCSKIPQ